ncbi:choice-of-anchor L domain-containing protein, partial [Flavobacterium sp. j3]
MKQLFFFFFFFISFVSSVAQPITVNTTTYTVPQLVQDVLFAPGTANSSCVGAISNINWLTGTNFNSENGIGFFQNTNPNFPLASGVILSTGNALSAPGPNTTTLSQGLYTFPGTTNTWFGDTDLYNYILDLNIIDPSDNYFNATILEFDFTPLTNQMSFDFLFASEEYGAFQCTYSDAFAFFLSDLTAGTPAINLALVPNTTDPISVTTIRDDANASCGPENVTYFGSNNQGTNAATSATNFNGQTALMTATSPVIPNHVYRIKLVIADLNDGSFDSAVFLGGGSFNIGSAEITGTGEFDGIQDFSGTNAICGSKTVLAQAGSVPIPGATYSWALNGNPIAGATFFNYTITDQGTYCVTITFPGGCQQTDCMVVEYLATASIGVPNDLVECAAPFNLTDNSALILNGASNPISFHQTLADAQELASPIFNATNFNGFDGQTIYVGVEDNNTGCIVTTEFDLQIDPSLCIVSPVPLTPPNLTLCESSFNSGFTTFDFTSQSSIIYGTNNPLDYTISYHTSQAEANSGSGAINPINSFTGSNGQTIYVRLQENALPTNFGTTSFQLIVNSIPSVTISSVPSVCPNESATIVFNGTPNSQVTYNINSDPSQIINLSSSGNASIATQPLTATVSYNLLSISNLSSTCSQPQTGSAVVTVNTAPTIVTPSPLVVCDDSNNNDGIACF